LKLIVKIENGTLAALEEGPRCLVYGTKLSAIVETNDSKVYEIY